MVVQVAEQDDKALGLGDYLAILRRRKKTFLVPAFLVFAAAVALAMWLPPVYESHATILIEQQEIPSDLVRSTVTSYAGERIQIISRRVMTSANLQHIIEKFDLYPKLRRQRSLSSVIEKMRGNTSLEMISADVVDPRSRRPGKATIAFQIGFAHNDPMMAQQVAAELVSLFLAENVRQRTQSAQDTTQFLASEAERLKQEVDGLEERLARFKERNVGNLPELQQLNLQLMERAERDLKDTETHIRSLQERATYLRAELSRIDPSSGAIGSDGKRVPSAEDRLRALQAEYISLSSRYSPTHPDVLKLSREIEALQRETGLIGGVADLESRVAELEAQLDTLRQRYSARHPDVKKVERELELARRQLAQARRSPRRSLSAPVNPAYVQLQAQLRAAEAELRSYREAREEIRGKIQELEERLMASPRIEREYRVLTRDYEQALAKYREVKDKLLEAELATSLERENKGERFSLLEPPEVPERPIKPNRIALIFLGLVLSLGSGLGAVAVAEGLSHGLRSPREVVAVTGGMPLVIVPCIETSEDVQRRRLRKWLVFQVALLVVVGALALVHVLVAPLDQLWQLVAEKLNLRQG